MQKCDSRWYIFLLLLYLLLPIRCRREPLECPPPHLKVKTKTKKSPLLLCCFLLCLFTPDSGSLAALKYCCTHIFIEGLQSLQVNHTVVHVEHGCGTEKATRSAKVMPPAALQEQHCKIGRQHIRLIFLMHYQYHNHQTNFTCSSAVKKKVNHSASVRPEVSCLH